MVRQFNSKTIIYCKKKRVSALIIDEIMIQTGGNDVWPLVGIVSVSSTALGVFLCRHRNMLVAESFLKSLINTYSKHIGYSEVEHGIQKHVLLLSNINCLHLLRKAWLEEHLAFQRQDRKFR